MHSVYVDTKEMGKIGLNHLEGVYRTMTREIIDYYRPEEFETFIQNLESKVQAVVRICVECVVTETKIGKEKVCLTRSINRIDL